MSKVKDQIVHFVDDWTHADALAQTGFWGAYGGAGSIFLARDTGRLLLARRSHHVLQPGTWGTIGGAVDRGGPCLKNRWLRALFGQVVVLPKKSGAGQCVFGNYPLKVGR